MQWHSYLLQLMTYSTRLHDAVAMLAYHLANNYDCEVGRHSCLDG